MEAILPWHHLLTVPEGLQDPTHPGPHSILFQCDDKAGPVHSVIGLPEVQEYQQEGVLVYAGELLGDL